MDRIGLCRTCRHADVIETASGSQFYRCRLSDTHPQFLKYPPLPVLRCSGYESSESSPLFHRSRLLGAEE